MCVAPLFLLRKLKREIGRKPIGMSFHRLIDRLRRHLVQLRQVLVEHDPLAANDIHSLFDDLGGILRGQQFLLRHERVLSV
jgi:hypothetical protein